MAETIRRTSALQGLLEAGIYTPAGPKPGVAIQEVHGVKQLQVIARTGKEAALASRVAKYLGRKSALKPLEGAATGDLFIAATGPLEYWALAKGRAAGQAMKIIEELADGCASVFDQSDGRFVVRLSRSNAANVLAKGTPLDLREPELPAQGAMHSLVAHIPALVIRRKKSAYDISAARSYAGSFAAWLCEAAREYSPVIEQA